MANGKPVIGFLNSQPSAGFAAQEAEFRGGLKDGGYTQSVDVEVLYRQLNSPAARL
jgi:hypothetical protein